MSVWFALCKIRTMSLEIWIAYLLTVSAVVISPGPDTLLILRHSLSSGRAVGIATVAGVQFGLMIHITLAILGISMIIASSPLLFNAVATAGAIYLGWLGWQAIRDGRMLRMETDATIVTPRRACTDAMLTNLLNPKVILLFIALLPNFVDTSRGGVAGQLIRLGVVLIAVNVVWQLPMAWIADRARFWLGNPRVERRISLATGSVFLLFAALIIWDHLAGSLVQ